MCAGCREDQQFGIVGFAVAVEISSDDDDDSDAASAANGWI